jgi:predicted acylesterase/phospholipase RssA
VVITPDVRDVAWNSFDNAHHLIEAGERAARAVIPQIQRWFPNESAVA